MRDAKASSLSVRAAAAEALAEVGDERAIRPLTEALRGCCVTRSALRQIFIGLLVFPAGLVGFVLLLLLGLLLGVCPDVGSIGVAVEEYYSQRRLQGTLAASIGTALQRIAERHPGPELRAALPELKAACADLVHQERGTRSACREAARKIEALTEQLKNLPTPASGPTPAPAALPVPVGAVEG